MMELEVVDAEETLDQDDLEEAEGDEEAELNQTTPTSPARKYQQNLQINGFLPYSSLLEQESQEWLIEIKEGLARSLLTGDYRPGYILWLGRMEQYLRLYGRKFTKQDHLQLVQLFFQVVVDDSMELAIVSRSAQILTDLLRKLELLTPSDLELPWRRLYDLVQRISYSRDEWHGLVCVPDSMERRIAQVIQFCRPYFAPSATQEMLDEWRPLLCPLASSMKKAIRCFNLFLPTLTVVERQPWTLWFDELMGIWLSFSGVPSWEGDLVSLLSRLALDTCGRIDWTPHLPAIFNKSLRNMRLPVGKKRLKLIFGNKSFDPAGAAFWPIAMMHLEGCLVGLEQLFQAVESYFYPSNHGEWFPKLSSMLMRLPMGVVSRVNSERHREKTWMPDIPAEHHLTDEQIRRFVRAIKPLVLLNMYSKHPIARMETMIALKHLSELCPQEILPALLDKLYPALESVTEPHRLTAALSAITVCMRGLFVVEDGRKNVLPLMMAVLPGIDSNDFRKSACTFQFLTCIMSLVPVEDSSRLADREDLTEEERDLCLQTAGFEEFTLQCVERCLTYISNSTNDLHGRHDSVSRDIDEKMTHEERFTRLGMSSLIATIVYQSSDQICQAVLEKLFSFVSNRTLSYSHYTGASVSGFCAMAVKLRPEIAGKEILEPVVKLLRNRVQLRERDIGEDEQVDDELAWTIKLAADTLSASGSYVLPHKAMLLQTLHTLKSARSTIMYKLVATLLRAILKGLLTTFPRNVKSVFPQELGINPADLVPVRHWAQLISPKKLSLEWHVPSEEEVDFAQEILNEFLLPALEGLRAHSEGESLLERKQLERTLLFVEMCLGGAGVRMPFDTEPENRILPCPTMIKIYSIKPDPTILASSRWILLKGLPARQYIFDHIQPLLRKISAADEDDVRSIKIILRILRSLMFYRGVENEELQQKIKSHIISRKTMSRVLGSPKEQMRLVLYERVALQHDRRHYDHRGSPMTKLRYTVMKEMIDLATGQYRDIRILGQNYFQDAIANIGFSYRTFVDDIVNKLDASKDSKEMAAQMKGSLYLILGGRGGSLILKHDWHTVSKCFPCLTKVTSESKTVGLVLDKLADKMDRHFSTSMIHIPQSEGAIRAAHILLAGNPPSPPSDVEMVPVVVQEKSPQGVTSDGDGPPLDSDDIWEKRAIESRHNESLYFLLVNELLDFVRERLTKPKNFHFALFALSYFIRRDVAVVPNLIDTFMDQWANASSEKARKLSQHPMLSFLRWLKRPIVRTELHLRSAVPAVPVGQSQPPLAGIRQDNLWLCFDEAKLPRNSEEYEACVFVEKVEHGYYGWPDKLTVAAPVKDQPVLGKLPETLNQLEKVVYEKMTDETYVDILVRLLAVEDSKMHPKFDQYTYWIFRVLFRHFEDAFLPLLLPHLDRLILSKEEHQHRCAAEILAGIVRGSKRWPFKKMSRLWEQLTPVIKKALANLTLESLPDWAEFAHWGLNEGDSRRTFPLLKVLFDLPRTDTSFQASSRLVVLQSAFFVHHDWRRKELHLRVLGLMKERMEERYRDRVASTLANMYRCDLDLPNLNKAIEQGPRLSSFVEEYFPACRDLVSATSQSEGAMRIFKTMVKLISQHVLTTMAYSPPHLQWFLALVMRFESDTRDEELRTDCITALACLSQMALSPPSTEEVLKQTEKVLAETSNHATWRDRVLALEHLQTVVFNNLFKFKQRKDWVTRVQTVTLNSLEDESLEVREMASTTLAGLAQCCLLKMDKSLLKQFFLKSETRYQRTTTQTDNKWSKDLLKRHAGVLGLCAYIVAYPYSIGEHEADVLVVLSGHLNDPQPINQTVKNTIKEFRRTHLDNWSEHKTKFSEEQLATLTDLLVSPTYYA